MAKSNRTIDRIQAIWNMIGGDDIVDQLIAGTAKLTVEIIRRLTALKSFAVEAGEINLKEFFKTREGLWVSDDFNNLILTGVSKESASAAKTTLGYADLAQRANDAEIGGELPEGHVFTDVVIFLGYLATLIKGQWGGREGKLINNDYANIFYVKVNGDTFAVRTRWIAGAREWRCHADRLSRTQWLAGGRAFSATASHS